MNNLNSFLIEGIVISDPEKKPIEGNVAKLCVFSIESKRYYSKDNERKEEISHFNVEVWNRTADWCLKNLTKNMMVRVVGRVRETRGRYYVVGETVEIKNR